MFVDLVGIIPTIMFESIAIAHGAWIPVVIGWFSIRVLVVSIIQELVRQI